MNKGIHLHTHSEYSMLDGMASTKKMFDRASELGHSALAITDHGNLHGAVEFYKEGKKRGIKPILGLEAYLNPFGELIGDNKSKKPYHLLLLAKNNQGFKNLSALSTLSHTKGFYYKPRIDHVVLEQYKHGIICTTGCLAGEIPRLITSGGDYEKMFLWYLDIFKDDFYIELQEHNISELTLVNEVLFDLSKRYGVAMIETRDSHYVKEADAIPHDLLLCVGTNAKVGDADRMKFNDTSYFMASDDESCFPEAWNNTLLVGDKCDISFGTETYKIPSFNNNPIETLKNDALEGLKVKYPNTTPETISRLEFELSVINKMGFANYMLIVSDIIRFCKEKGIYYSIRGSAAGSIVSYCLDITKVEPISGGLFFERFLNPDRVSMPDIDMDFEDERRHEVVKYTLERWGEDNVASIVTFGTMATKGALKDVGRVMNVPLRDVESLTKLIPNGAKACDLRGAMDIPDFKAKVELNPNLKGVYTQALKLEGVVRNAGIHAAGVVIADKPISEYVPLMRSEGKLGLNKATQYEMKWLEELGLLKMDYLGLSTLTVVRKAIAEINKAHGLDLTFDTIPVGDAKSWELLSKGDAMGVFQLSSDGMTAMIKKMKPTCYEHIIAAVALYRPGPMDYIPTFIRRLHGLEAIPEVHPDIDKNLSETYGVMTYQEQIMKVAHDFAGFTLAEADFLRKAIGKKDIEGLLKQESKFIDGAVKRGVDKELAQKIWNDILPSARYSFNKAHAAVYAQLACKTAWLKAHYPKEFIAAYIDSELSGKPEESIPEIKRKIKLYPPTFAFAHCHPYKDGVRIGSKAVKGIGVDFCERLASCETHTVQELISCAKPSKKELEACVKSGLFDELHDRAALIESIPAMLKYLEGEKKLKGVIPLFKKPLKLENRGMPLTEDDLMASELENFGYYISKSPLEKIADVFTVSHTLNSDFNEGEQVLIAGIGKVRTHPTKKGDTMAFIDLEDATGKVSVTAFPRTYSQFNGFLKDGVPITICGKVNSYNGKLSIVADVIAPRSLHNSYPHLFANKKNEEEFIEEVVPTKPPHLYAIITDQDEFKLQVLVEDAKAHHGDSKFSIIIGGKIYDYPFTTGIDIETIADILS